MPAVAITSVSEPISPDFSACMMPFKNMRMNHSSEYWYIGSTLACSVETEAIEKYCTIVKERPPGTKVFVHIWMHSFHSQRVYCNRTKFRTRFNFVYFVLLAGSTKFSSIRKPCTYTSVSDTTVAVRKFLAYESWQTLEYEIFTRTKISAITVLSCSLLFLVWCERHAICLLTPHTDWAVRFYINGEQNAANREPHFSVRADCQK